jgi:hypothetical protein
LKLVAVKEVGVAMGRMDRTFVVVMEATSP